MFKLPQRICSTVTRTSRAVRREVLRRLRIRVRWCPERVQFSLGCLGCFPAGVATAHVSLELHLATIDEPVLLPLGCLVVKAVRREESSEPMPKPHPTILMAQNARAYARVPRPPGNECQGLSWKGGYRSVTRMKA
jgi:hypothetical protein